MQNTNQNNSQKITKDINISNIKSTINKVIEKYTICPKSGPEQQPSGCNCPIGTEYGNKPDGTFGCR